MPRITELYAYIAEDNGPDDEGVAAAQAGNMMMPLIGADVGRSKRLRAVAQHVARTTGKRLRLVRFSVREELEVLEP